MTDTGHQPADASQPGAGEGAAGEGAAGAAERERVADAQRDADVVPAPTPSVQVSVVMGSTSDWDVMRSAVGVLDEFGVSCDVQVLSAHRMPDEMFAFAEAAAGRGVRAIIAGAGGAAHLPGMLAAKTIVPVLGVPVPSRHLGGEDSLLSIVQMPAGVPVATFAIGRAGATNAALFAVAMLAADDAQLVEALVAYREQRRATAAASSGDLTR